MKKIFFITIFLGLLICTLNAMLINVPTNYTTIQEGINAASDYDTVLVDTGTYVENINFNGKNITVASLYLTTKDTSYISLTIIDGNNSGTVVTFENGEDSTAILCGFTVINGNQTYGGGITFDNSSPKLQNLLITQNYAGTNGGGVNCYYNSHPIINYVIISYNQSGQYGGGFTCVSYSNPTLNNVSILSNTADIGGGGLNCYLNSNPTLNNVKISNNFAEEYGGGVYCINSNPILENVTISNNIVNEYGGGICCSFGSCPSLDNVTVSNNTSGFAGGGLNCYSNSNPILDNVTMSNNSSVYGGGIYCDENSSPSLVNCILWNDYPQEVYFNYYNNSNTITILYSDIEGGEIDIVTNNNGTVNWLDGNIDNDPLFVDPSNGDYHLSWINYPIQDTTMSPCIDTGDPNSSLDPDGTTADMGAYYFNQSVSIDDTPALSQYKFYHYPNPIRYTDNTINVSFTLKKNSNVCIELYNIKGQLIEKIIDKKRNIGNHLIGTNASNLSSGIFFMKLNIDGHTKEINKFVIIK